jgi:hypothetical protein
MSALTEVPSRSPGGFLRWTGITAIIFGVATLFSGGAALFGPSAARDMLGAIVPYVLWFNFLSGAVYIATGIGLLRRRASGARLSLLLAVAITLVVGAFCWHVATGGAYEMRTVGALILRSGFWIFAAVLSRPLCRI